MRTLTVNFKIVTSAPGDENLSEVISHVLKRIAGHPEIAHGDYASDAEFILHYTIAGRKEVATYQAIEPHDQLQGVLVDYPPQTFKATVTATYENTYDPPLPAGIL